MPVPDSTNHRPNGASPPRGIEQFMTVDAFDVQVGPGRTDTAIVTKDHSGPLPDRGRTAAEHRSAIDREKQWLRNAAGIAGVVRLADGATAQEPDAIVTEFAGSRTLRSHCPEPLATASALACVAETIDGLSARGMVHGSIAPEHVILTTDGAAVLCSPNSSNEPDNDLIGLGRCIEYATEQWENPPDSLTRWLLLAKQLNDQDPTVGPAKTARVLRDLSEPDPEQTRRWATLTMVLVTLAVAALMLVAGQLRSDPSNPVSGPELAIGGNVVRVGSSGHVAVARPDSSCDRARIYLLDPTTHQIWTFDQFDTGRTASPLVMVPGATDIALSETTRDCVEVVVRGPAGEVILP